MKKVLAVVTAGLFALGISGCSSSTDSGTSDKADAKVTVFATTNVWGSVAKHIGGDKINVEESITRPDQDPHDYESTAQDKLKVSKAKIAIVNGGGYDAWGEKLADSVDPKPTVINAVELSGLMTDEDKAEADEHAHEHEEEHADHDADHDADHAEEGHEHHHHHHGGFNEHVFYSLDTIEKVGDELAKQLSKVDPDNADTYKANAKDFDQKIDDLEAKAEKHKDVAKDVDVIATEPVVGYLLEEMGMHDVTPAEYVEQSETEAGPSTKVMADTKALISSGKVKGLILNGQTEDAVSDQLVKEAEAKNIPIVKVYESFPEGTSDILDWLDKAIDDLSQIK